MSSRPAPTRCTRQASNSRAARVRGCATVLALLAKFCGGLGSHVSGVCSVSPNTTLSVRQDTARMLRWRVSTNCPKVACGPGSSKALQRCAPSSSLLSDQTRYPLHPTPQKNAHTHTHARACTPCVWYNASNPMDCQCAHIFIAKGGRHLLARALFLFSKPALPRAGTGHGCPPCSRPARAA